MSTLDSATLERLRQLLQDPAARAQLQDLINSAPGGSKSLSSALLKAGQSGTSTNAALGNQLGTLLGTGIGYFLKRRHPGQTGQPKGSTYNQPAYQGDTAGEDSPGVRASPAPAPAPIQTTPTAGVTPSAAPIAPSDYERGATVVEVPPPPNAGRNMVARAQQSVAPIPQQAVQAAPIGTGPSRLLMGTDAQGDPVGSTDGGRTWRNDRGQAAVGQVTGITDIGNPGPVPINQITGLPYPSATVPRTAAAVSPTVTPRAAVIPPAPLTVPIPRTPLEQLASPRIAALENSMSPTPLTSYATTAAPTATPGAGPSRLMMGSDARGNPVHSYDGGTTWITDSGQMASGPVYNKTNIGGAMRKGGRLRGFAKGGGGEDIPVPPPDTGRRVLRRGPPGHGMPVLATTIVIGVKKKGKDEKPGRKKPAKKTKEPEKKAKGGEIKVAANQHQRSVMPRGWGAEIRGRKSARIY